MPSWVMPAVAAELWGVSVAHVLAEVAAGRIHSRHEGEFIFVDIDPAGGDVPQKPACVEPRPATHRRSLTWTLTAGQAEQPDEALVTAAERDALLDESFDRADDSADFDDDLDDADLEGLHPSDSPTGDDVPNWDEIRARVSQTRRPPRLREAA